MEKKGKLVTLLVLLCICCWIILSWKPAKKSTVEARKDKSAPVLMVMPSAAELVEQKINTVYDEMQLRKAGLTYAVFEKGYIGYLNLKKNGQVDAGNPILSIVDFTKSSKTKRLWILDLSEPKVLLKTWVSHGEGSGGDIPTHFSNQPNSHQSSLGFYLTGEVYYGKHGRSLRLDGMDKGFNSMARERAIVLHGADYVSQQAINHLNRLGRSFGCPAVSNELSDQVIDWVKNQTVLYIHGAEPDYHSVYLDKHQAGRRLLTAFVEGNKNGADTAGFVL